MARITTVAKAQKAQGKCRKCGKSIEVGDSYKWFANRIGRMSLRKVYCSSCPIRQSDMTTSDKLGQLYSAQEELEDAISKASCVEDISSALQEAAEQAREVAEGYRESVGNMPDSLQNSSQCDEMNEKADNCDAWADELEQAADEVDGLETEPDEGDECASCGKPYSDHGKPDIEACDDFESVDDPVESARQTADEACGNLSV